MYVQLLLTTIILAVVVLGMANFVEFKRIPSWVDNTLIAIFFILVAASVFFSLASIWTWRIY